jgi:PqqD family protein of HPr-rel-A system
MVPMSPDLGRRVWRVARPASLELRRWDGETLVYDPFPGSTHLLDPVSSAVLDCLITADSSAREIARTLVADFGTEAEQDVLEAVQAALARLREADLIRSAAP